MRRAWPKRFMHHSSRHGSVAATRARVCTRQHPEYTAPGATQIARGPPGLHRITTPWRGGDVSDDRKPRIEPYAGPAGGWGSVKSVVNILRREKVPVPSTVKELWRQNKPGGFTCVSCAWPQRAEPPHVEFCENGAKASAWELTSLRTTPAFFAEHSVTELRDWSDHDLEQQG